MLTQPQQEKAIRLLATGIGRTKTTSTSNTKKIMTTIKNFREKGDRALLIASNPHSNASKRSRSQDPLLEQALTTPPRAKGMMILNTNTNSQELIWILGLTYWVEANCTLILSLELEYFILKAAI
jgi:hypothetical protein